MWSRSLRLLSVLAALAPTACGDALSPVAAAEVTGALSTDASAYTARRVIMPAATISQYEFTIVARYRNTTGADVYLARCYPNTPYPIYGIRLVSGTNVNGAAYDPAWACVGHNQQIRVAAGEARVDTLTIRGPNAFLSGTDQFLGVIEGRYRLVYYAQTCQREGECMLPSTESNEFTVKTEP